MTTLYVGKFNLSAVGEEQLRRAFQPFGSLNWVRIKEGYAFVDFAEECAAQDAYQAHEHGLVLYGERMVVRWARLQQRQGVAQAKFPLVETKGSDERRFGGPHVTNVRPSFQGTRRFCTICCRAGHDTNVCYYNTAVKREARGGAERGAKVAAWRARGDDHGRDQRRDRDTTRLAKGTKLRGANRAEHRPNARDRGTLEGKAQACGGNPEKVPAAEGTGGRAKERPPEGKGAHIENAKALVCAAEMQASGSKRKGQSGSRGRSRSRSVTRCSDSRCNCQQDRNVFLSPPRSLSPSACTASSPSRGRHAPRQSLSPQKEKQDAPLRTTPRSVSPPRKKAKVLVDPGLVEPAMGPPVGKGNRSAWDDGPREKQSGSGVSSGPGAEVEKAGLIAQAGRGQEGKRKWGTDARGTGGGKDLGQAERADEPPAKRAQLSNPPEPTPLDRAPHNGSLPTKPHKRLELAALGKEDMVIPRITEWQFETQEDAAEDDEITSVSNKRPLPGTDLPARLRPIRWRNIGKDVKRGRGWKNGLEILARGWESGRSKEARGVGEVPQGRTGCERAQESRKVIGDPSKVRGDKESLAPSFGTGRKATQGGDSKDREERMEPRLPTVDTPSRGARMSGGTSGDGPPKQGDAAVQPATERVQAGGQATGLLRVKAGSEKTAVAVEPAGETVDPARLTELRPAALQSVQGFEAVPVRYKYTPEVTAPAPTCADGPDPAKASENPPEMSGRSLEASERPQEAFKSPAEASGNRPDAPASPAGAPEIAEICDSDAPIPQMELKAPESMAPGDTSSPEQQLPPESKPSPEKATESAPTPKSAGTSDPRSLSEPRTPLPGSELAAPQPADESAPTSGGGDKIQPSIVEPSTAAPKRKRGRPPKKKAPEESKDTPKPKARVKRAEPLSTEGPKPQRARARNLKNPPEPDEMPAAPIQKLPDCRKTASEQQPGVRGPEPADASQTPGVVAGGEDGSSVDLDDLPLSDRVADAIKARGSFHTRAKTGGAGMVATAKSNKGALSGWAVGGKGSFKEACYPVQTEQNVCLLVFPKDRSEAHQAIGEPDPYSQLVLDFPGVLTPEMVLEPSAFSSESQHKASEFASLLPRLLLTGAPPAAADQAAQPASGALPQATGKETGPAKDDQCKGAPQAGSGGLVPEEATAERAILPCRPDRNLKTAPG
ncbi:hypothetical protein KFL_006390020 [Klebsormidium nitens]|uniref:RRM domain-containing protein n=1 Tax=Klebsormidium nitens TaxID=105231 RepID=A0A1Y1IP93_KLENI|nr:hypothetical protein KFL_006390020 [Klebsormidium nitens]|eukprot:GAQ90437.1 hypothetical protein KFL_006390020 [Klebsormidium nitens]